MRAIDKRLLHIHDPFDKEVIFSRSKMFCLLKCCCCCSLFTVIFAILFALKVYLKYKIGYCKSARRLDGKTAIVTGANTGIGYETAKDLAQRRARVILACRDLDKAMQARDEIVTYTGNQDVVVRKLDLADLSSVREFAKEINATENRLDILINNAGAGGLPQKKTVDGLELGMQVNHFGPFLLTNLLVDLLKKSAPSRIVFVASVAHKVAKFDIDNLNSEKSFSGFQIYACSKVANILNATELARRLTGTGVTVNSLHPGTIHTEIWRRVPFGFRQVATFILKHLFKTPLEGAQTTIHCAVSEEVDRVTGKYFAACKEATPSLVAQDMNLAKKLWQKSEACTSQKSKKN